MPRFAATQAMHGRSDFNASDFEPINDWKLVSYLHSRRLNVVQSAADSMTNII